MSTTTLSSRPSPAAQAPAALADDVHSVGKRLRACFATAEQNERPYRHWHLHDVFSPVVAQAISDLPFAAPEIGDTAGRRETHNSSRIFFATANQAAHPVCAAVAQALQAEETVARIEERFRVDLAGSNLRIEYCMDRAGFWLEPHTDIGAKLFTMLVYLTTGPEAEILGTDIMAGPQGPAVGRASGHFNTGLIFVPGADTWHGFAPRPFTTIRRTVIINYVKPEWRARHELAFPDTPIAG